VTLVVELSPPEAAHLQAVAERQGVPITELVRKAVASYLPSTNPAEVQANAASIALLRSWLADAPTDPDAVHEAENDLGAFKRNINRARQDVGAPRLVYPESEQAE
jgi:hypothetical protein